ncbi:MAG: 4-(cytidine 5'-diphospho)-2-C-methyl-D-erythritol kinase [Bradyrhizobiaceae bacterium]|nr:4-(cytidine 5'-diphospho)-2-C-methyl-D-erythritol kinase [Bradyrhizobiaceae bacterium]
MIEIGCNVSLAPAKINLTLRISGRRADGYHEIESLVAFAPFGDRLAFTPGATLDLEVSGPTADGAGPVADNLVLRAARALAERIDGLRLGRFALHKELPAGAGLGGGSADAAAALRLLAAANGVSLDDRRLHDAARATGADIPVCLDPRPRVMRGIGEILSAPATLPPLGILVIHPGFALPTGPVFKALGLRPGEPYAGASPRQAEADRWQVADRDRLFEWLVAECNDLEAPAIASAPAVAGVLRIIAGLAGCRLARMSGSGSACFGLFDDGETAASAASRAAQAQPSWWVRAGTL